MEYTTAFWVAQVGDNISGLGIAIAFGGTLAALIYGMAKIAEDRDTKMPYTLRKCWIAVVLGFTLAFTGGMVPNKTTLIYGAAATHGIAFTERLLTLIEKD